MKKKILASSAVIAIMVSGLVVGCGGGGDDGGIDSTDGTVVDVVVTPGDNPPPQPPETNSTIVGTKLACTPVVRTESIDAADFNKSTITTTNVSTPTGGTQDNREKATGNNTLIRMSGLLVDATSRNGDRVDLNTDTNLTHPLIVSYTQQVVGAYELGDGSADVPDPDQRDGLFVALSYDNGATWKDKQLSNSEDKTSIKVLWNGANIDYYGHVQKPSMAVHGNNILIAYNDKYCQLSNPLDLPQDDNNTFYTDYFDMVGKQGTIDYGGIKALPNDKLVYEAPFSCVWTVRGVFNADPDADPATDDYTVTWHKPMQLTSGMRDSNHIKIAASKAGFALAWQEDTEGLRAGKGEGPGDGWSGATTNHGTDIWYSSIKMEDFNLSTGTDNNISSVVNFHYPVRITDNEICQPDDTKLYCERLCDIGTVAITETNNNKTDSVTRCLTHDTDWLLTDSPLALPELNDTVVLDGDTGASRPAMNILETDAGEFVVVLGYEETKGLSLTQAAAQDMGETTTDIEVEGKSVYFESFLFSVIDDFNASDPDAMFKVAMPLVSAGDIVNIRVPEVEDPYAVDPVPTGEMIYENARRLVIGTQVDSCDAENYTFAFLYKQSFDTQGASSDMFVRVNNGFTYDSFTTLADGYGNDLTVTNVSAQKDDVTYPDAQSYVIPNWESANLLDQTYDNNMENTFSPRVFLRGDDIYAGFAYTPDDAKTVQGNMPTNFHTSIYMDGKWVGPENVSKITKGGITSEDPRFIPTPKALNNTLASDASNPNVLWVAWGTIDTNLDVPEGIYFKRAIYDSVNTVWNWDDNATKLADRETTVVQESAVQVVSTPDGKTLHSVWIQEVELENYTGTDPFYGLDTWYGRVDINETE